MVEKLMSSKTSLLEIVTRQIGKKVKAIQKFVTSFSIIIEDVKHVFYAKINNERKELIGLYVKANKSWNKVLELSKKEYEKWINK